MGAAQSGGGLGDPRSREEAELLFTFPRGVQERMDAYSFEALTRYSVLDRADPQWALVQKKIDDGDWSSAHESRAMASVFGMACGDALGAPLEFSPVRYTGQVDVAGLEEEHTDAWYSRVYNRFGLKPGQWTDDASMGLAMAESLLYHQGLNPLDLRARFLGWWKLGYCNAFGYDKQRSMHSSVGLGGNIGASMSEFENRGTEYTRAGNRKTSGNGSLMRLAPCPVFFARSGLEAAMDAAYKQSKTTHQGDESAECCRLMSYVMLKAFERADSVTPQQLLDTLPGEFTSPLYSVQCLAASKREERHEDNEGQPLSERDWNWRRDEHRFAPGRARKQPGYVGSYAMDALAMALHCVYTTNTFRDAVVKCANLRGDADTTASITGQIAGAFYGMENVPRGWIDAVQQWDNGGGIALRAYKLYHHQPVAKIVIDDSTPPPERVRPRWHSPMDGDDGEAFPDPGREIVAVSDSDDDGSYDAPAAVRDDDRHHRDGDAEEGDDDDAAFDDGGDGDGRAAAGAEAPFAKVTGNGHRRSSGTAGKKKRRVKKSVA